MRRLSVAHRDRGERRFSFKNGRWGLGAKSEEHLEVQVRAGSCRWQLQDNLLHSEEGEDIGELVQEAIRAAQTSRASMPFRAARELDTNLYDVLCLASRLLQKWLYQRVMALESWH
jgi:hypothetical protein